MPAGSDDGLGPALITKKGASGPTHGEEVLLARGAGVSTGPETEASSQSPAQKPSLAKTVGINLDDVQGTHAIGSRSGFFPGPSRR